MALTKVTGSVIKDSVSLSGNVSVGGTLTYQDVTNVDALGIGTFRTGINVSGGQVDIGSNIKLGNAGVVTATSFVGSSGLNVLDGRVKIGTTSNTPASANEPGIVFGDNTAGTATKGIASFCANGAAPLLLTRRVSDGNVLGIADDTTTRGMVRVNSNDLEITAIEELRLSTGAGHNEKIRLTNAGRFGLGVSGPDAMLHVKGSDNVLALFESTDADSLIQFKDNSTSDTILIGALGGDDLVFRCDPGDIIFNLANNNEKLRINSSGQLIMTNAATHTFFNFSTTNNNTRGLFSVSGKDTSGNAVTVRIGGFGDTSRGEIFTQSNHSLGFATNNAAAQVILHTSGLFDVVGECRATNFYLRGNGSAPSADASIFRPADNTLAFATASTERIRIENSGISGDIKNNYALVAFVSDRDDGSRTTGSASFVDDTGLNLSNAITYRHGDILFVEALCPTGIALVSTDTANYEGVIVRVRLRPTSGSDRYSNETKGWYRDDGRATKETMPLTVTHYHLQGSDTSSFNDNVQISFQVQYKRSGGAGSYGALGLSVWNGERTLKVWQYRKAL